MKLGRLVHKTLSFNEIGVLFWEILDSYTISGTILVSLIPKQNCIILAVSQLNCFFLSCTGTIEIVEEIRELDSQ